MNKIHDINNTGRDFIVSDLHGCFDLFTKTLKKINFDKEKDRMFSVGDLVDRGKNSLECLYLLTEDWFHAVKGNHEDLMIKSVLEGQDSSLWDMNGGLWHHAIPRAELLFLANLARALPLSITIKNDRGDVGICHAQPPSLDWSDTENPNERDELVMIWGRSWIADKLMEDVSGVSATFHGHTIIDEPITIGNVTFIDTGAFHTGALTCIEIFNEAS